MNCTITTTLDLSIYNFLDLEAKNTKKTKKSIIEEALRIYQKNQLKSQIEAGLSQRYEEYKSINDDFQDSQFSSINK